MNWKNILKIVSLLLVIGGVVWGGYYIWTNYISAPASTITAEQAAQEQAAAAQALSKLKTLSDKEVFDYWTESKTGTIYFLNLSGQVYKISSDGKEELANQQTINQLNSVKASPDGSYAVAKFNYPELPTFSLFNTATNLWQPLANNLISAAWSPDSQSLAYLENKDSSGRLAILNIASNKIQEVAKMTQKDLNLAWVKPKEIFFYQTPSADLVTSYYSINIDSKIIKPLIKDANGLVIKWSDDSELGIKTQNIKRAAYSNLINGSGNDLVRLNFDILPDKCVISQLKIFCGVPRSVGVGVLPDDYYKKSIYTQDDLLSINLSTGKASIAFDNPENKLIDVYHLFLNNDRLLFINRYDNKLYSLDLK